MRKLLNTRLSRRGGVTLLAALLGLALAEGFATRMGPAPHPQTTGVLLRAAADPLLETEHTPGARQQIIFRERSGRSVRTVEHVISESGWRGPAFSVTKPAGVFRVICVGDSHTFGHGVDEHETWPRALERELSRGASEPRVEVLNFGVGGYEGAQKVALIEQRALDCAPDLIVLQLYMNDVAVGHRNLARRGRRSPLMRWSQPRREGWIRELRQRSSFCDLVLSNLFGRMCLANYMAANTAGFEASNPHWLDLQRRIRSCRDLLERRGVAFMIVLYPLLFEQSGRLASHGVGHAIGDFCRGAGIPFVDLEPEFLGRALTPLRIHPLDYHVTGEAHALAARATVRGLIEHRLLSGLTPSTPATASLGRAR